MRRILLIAAALIAFASPSRAADSTVAALTAASTLTGAELLYCVQGGADRKCTFTQAATYTFSTISGDCTVAAGVITCVKTNGVAFGALATVTPGTGIATALGVNVGSAGAPVINGGALGTPSSGNLSNATALPISTGVSGLGTGVATALAIAAGTGSGFALQSERASPSNFGLASVDNSTILASSGQLSANVGTSGATIPLLNGNNTFSGTMTLSGLTTGTQVSCLGLTSGNAVVAQAGACGSGGGGGITIGTTTITSGTSLRVLYDNAGVVGEYTATQLTALMNVATASLSGAVPSWPNDPTKFFNGQGNYITAVTSITFGPGTSGGICSTSCTVQTALFPDAPSAGVFPYAIPSTDAGKSVIIPASSGNLTIVAATTTGFGNGVSFWVVNEDTVTRTLTPASNISGKSTVPIPAGDAACFYSDGTVYHFCLPPALSVANNLADLNSASTARTNLGLGTAATQNTGTSGANLPFLNGANTWSGVQSVNSGDLALNGSGSGSTTLNAAATASGTLTLPAATDTLVARATTDTLTNKTLSSTTDVLGGVTMTLGSDATGDIYYRNSSGVLTRLAVCTGSNVLGASGGLPACVAQSGGSSTITAGTTATSGVTSGNLIGSTSNLVVDSGVPFANFPVSGTTNGDVAKFSNTTGALADSGVLLSSLAPLASPTFTGTVTLPDSGTATSNGLNSIKALGIGVAAPSTVVASIAGTSQTSSSANGIMALTQTWNTSGVVTAFSIAVTNTGSGAGSLLMNLLGGASGTTSVFSVGVSTGAVTTSGSVTATNGFGTSLAGTGYSHSASSNTTISDSFGNNSTNTAAQEQLKFNNANATPLQGSITINGSGYSGGNGANAFTIDGVTGLYLQGANTNALSIGASGAITVYNQPTTGTIVYGVCAAANANGSTGGALILDTSATVCGLSSMAFKKDIAAFDRRGMIRLASLNPITDGGNLAARQADVDPMEILRLSPAQFVGDGTTITYTKPQFGIMAQDACEVDDRICARFEDGSPRTPIPAAMMALQIGFDQHLWEVIQKQQAEIRALEARVR